MKSLSHLNTALKIVAIAHERRMPLYWNGRD